MTTLADMIKRTAQAIGGGRLQATTAAGTTTTTLVDAGLDEPDDWLNGGLLFFLSGTLAGKMSEVTDWVLSTHTLTFKAIAGNSSAPGSGATYLVFTDRYSKSDLIQAINLALEAIGPYAHNDDTLVVVKDQVEYDLPAGVSNVTRVQIAETSLLDIIAGDPPSWGEPERNWREIDGTLQLNDEDDALDTLNLFDGAKIRIWYNALGGPLVADTDPIPAGLNPTLLAWEAAAQAANARNGRTGNTEPQTNQLIQRAEMMRKEMRKHQVAPMRRDSRMSGW